MNLTFRKALDSKPANLVVRISLALVMFALATYAFKTFQVLNTYGIQYGTDLWFAIVLIIVSSTVGIVCIMLTGRGWVWAIRVWAVTALGLALIGVMVGLSTKYLMKWQVLMPWKRGGVVQVSGGVTGLLAVSGFVVISIHQRISAERDVFLEPLKERIASVKDCRAAEITNT